VTVTNTSSGTVNGWALGFTFPSGQQITNTWNASVTQSGSSVTARNVGHNGTLAPGASTSFGFQGTHGGTNGAPTGWALNGTACSS
jgi:cellulase/cellobiase CelA1